MESVVIFGSRFTNAPEDVRVSALAAVNRCVDELPVGTLVITGGARGVDRWAHERASARGNPTKVMPADWDKFGKRAGYIRNIAMLLEEPTRATGFWDGISKGTLNMYKEAKRRGVPVELFNVYGDSIGG